MLTTRTSSPYFSPNKASAPLAMASSGVIRWVSTAVFCTIMALTRSSTRRISSWVIGFWCEKSNLSRPGSTSEPFCATWDPSTWRSASCNRCVAE